MSYNTILGQPEDLAMTLDENRYHFVDLLQKEEYEEIVFEVSQLYPEVDDEEIWDFLQGNRHRMLETFMDLIQHDHDLHYRIQG
jgi:hypothetical protein